MKSNLIAAALLGLLASVAASAAPILMLNPAGISGTPGSTRGWGFTLSNTTDFLVVSSANYCAAPVSLPVCTPSGIGTFSDIISAINFIVVGPAPESTVVTQTFVNGVSGVGSFVIKPGAVPGTVEAGKIVLSYDLYAKSPNDPNFNPDTDTLLLSQVLTADATVTVTSAVPEPAFAGLIGLALAGLAIVRFRRAKTVTCSDI